MEKLQHSVYLLLFLSLGFAGLYFASPFLIPVILAAVLAMLFIGLANFFERKKISRALAGFCCILIFVGAVALVITLLSFQLSDLADNVGQMKNRLFEVVGNIRNWLNETVGIDQAKQKELIDNQTSGNTGKMFFDFASGLMGIVVNTVLVLVYMYLFLIYRSHIKKFILKLVAKDEKANADQIVHQTGEISRKYLSGLAAMIALLWVMYGIGFSLVGIENAIFFAILCGLLEIVPFVGNLTGTTITVLAVAAQGGNNQMIIWVIVTYVLVQLVQTYVLEPLVVGEQVNINPLFTIMAIVLGEMVWGVAGMILAIPLLGMIKIICDNHPDLKPYGFLIGPENPRKQKTAIIDKIKGIFKKN